MDRLIRRDTNGRAMAVIGGNCGLQPLPEYPRHEYIPHIDRLAAYEDLGPVDELAALKAKHEQGLVVELPCRVGDTVYSLSWSIMNNQYTVCEGTIVNVRYDASDGLVTVSDGEKYCKWGVKAFATRAEAKAAQEKEGQ